MRMTDTKQTRDMTAARSQPNGRVLGDVFELSEGSVCCVLYLHDEDDHCLLAPVQLVGLADRL